MKTNSSQRKKPQKNTANPVEAIKDFGSNLIDSAAKDLIGGVASDAFRQVLGPAPENIRSREQTFIEKEERKPLYAIKERALYIEENKVEIAQKTSLILTEIKQLVKETAGLKKQLGDFSLEEVPEDPGLYHFSFFGLILRIVRKVREQMHEAATWLVVWQTRSRKRGLLAGYGHGRGRKSTTAAIHKMLGSEMGAARSGA